MDTKPKRTLEEEVELLAPEKKPDSMSSNFKKAITGFLPLIIGGIAGGLDTGIAAQEGAFAAQEGQRKADLDERKMAAMEIQQERLERQKGLTDYQKRSLDLREEEINLKKGGEKRRVNAQAFKEEENELNKYRSISKDFTTDKVVSQTRGRLSEVIAGYDLLEEAKTNPVAASALPRTLARLSGEVGVLTDQDVDAFGGSKAILTRLEQAAKTIANGKLSETNRLFMQELIQAMEGSARKNLDIQADKFSGRASKLIKGVTPEELKAFLLQDEDEVSRRAKPVTPQSLKRTPGKIIRIKSTGQRYRVGEDGDTLIPLD